MEKDKGREKLKIIYRRNQEKEQTVEETYRLLTGDTYFKEHPENVLGLSYDTTNRHGRAKVGYKGKMTAILEKAAIDVAGLQVEELEVLDTVIEPSVEEVTQKEDSIKNIQKVLRNRIKRKTTIPKKIDSDYELMSFDEIIKTYNEGISEEEIKAWIWYKRANKQFIHDDLLVQQTNGWSKYVIPLGGSQAILEGWIKEGILCYEKGHYVPSVLYYAQNIYEKQAQLEEDKKHIIHRWGIEQYEKQAEGLRLALPDSLSLTTEDKNQRLIIKPNSDFSKQFKIKELADGTIIHDKIPFYSELRNEAKLYSLKASFAAWLKDLDRSEYQFSNSSDIILYYLDKTRKPDNMDVELFIEKKQNAKKEGDLFFQRFLAEAISEEDQQKIEAKWNTQFNGYKPIDYFKVPVAFHCSGTFKNKPLFIRPAQREGLGFLAVHGSGCIAYDVGVGKTMTGILSIAHALESGMCKRPMIVVPNQTYGNWLNELRGVVNKKGEVVATGVLPQYPINDLYNLSARKLEPFLNEDGTVGELAENSISLLTYEGFKRLYFNELTRETIKGDLFKILNQGVENSRDETKLDGKIDELMGKGNVGASIEIERLGFDFLLMDEAHIAKKVFAQVKGEVDDKGNRDRSDYSISAGTPSAIALKSFMIANYIQRNNNYSNVVLLTATPFTNSPLEIFSVLALIGYHRLEKVRLGNLQQFFNHFIQSSLELIINTQLNPERKEIIMGFNNLIALQQLIFQFIDYKSGEEAEIQRPNKIVLPLTHKRVDGKVIPLPNSEQISTTLAPNSQQITYMTKLELYLMGQIEFHEIFRANSKLEVFLKDFADTVQDLDDAAQKRSKRTEEQMGTRILRGITLGRQIAFSPYLLAGAKSDISSVSYSDFINSSPKLQYTMGCIASVKRDAEQMGEPMPGQVIYSNAGVRFFPLIKAYLVNEIGLEESEVDFIKGGMTPRKKELTRDKFLSGSLKVIIGSQTIREGLNLQNRATDIYNLWLDWNPTDQRQLEGRIWRFGNQYANVRIVIPLIQDSVDIAIFQKLEEKSSRINQIWHRSGKENVMKLEEFNPAELKTSLISNPVRLAEILILEKSELLKSEIRVLEEQIAEIDEIVETRDSYRKTMQVIEKTVNDYKPLDKGQKTRKPSTVFKIYGDYLDNPETNTTSIDESDFREARRAHFRLERIKQRFLEPRGIEMDFKKEKLVSRLEEEIELKETALEAQTDEKAKKLLVEQIKEERRKKNIKTKTVQEQVEAFATLNQKVIGEKMTYSNIEEDEQLQSNIIKTEKVVEVDDLLAQMKRNLEKMKKMKALAKRMEQIKKEAFDEKTKAA